MVALSASGRPLATDRRVVGRSAALGEVVEGYRSGGLGGPAAELRSEVAVLEPVGIAFEAEDLGVMDQPIDHRGSGHVIAEDLAPRNCSWHTFWVVGYREEQRSFCCPCEPIVFKVLAVFVRRCLLL
jgi:hypothetical protein